MPSATVAAVSAVAVAIRSSSGSLVREQPLDELAAVLLAAGGLGRALAVVRLGEQLVQERLVDPAPRRQPAVLVEVALAAWCARTTSASITMLPGPVSKAIT